MYRFSLLIRVYFDEKISNILCIFHELTFNKKSNQIDLFKIMKVIPSTENVKYVCIFRSFCCKHIAFSNGWLLGMAHSRLRNAKTSFDTDPYSRVISLSKYYRQKKECLS